MNTFSKSLTLTAALFLLIGIGGCEQIDEAKKAAGGLVTESVDGAKKAAAEIVAQSVDDAKKAIGIAAENPAEPQVQGEDQDGGSGPQQGGKEK